MKKLYIIGLGPGDAQFITPQAAQALEESQVVCGYTVYLDLIRPQCQGKEVITTPMTQEIQRCRMALEQAAQGKTTAMVLLELAEEYPAMEIQVVPGITAAVSGAAVLGAPLIHDFAVISLSDLLTPWEKIERRLDRAAQADFVLCLYNPRSKRRADHLQKACDIVMRHQSPDTVCGTVRNIGREGQQSQVMTLRELRDAPVDMFTTVFIGNSATRRWGQYMVTPRGYENKKQ